MAQGLAFFTFIITAEPAAVKARVMAPGLFAWLFRGFRCGVVGPMGLAPAAHGFHDRIEGAPSV